MRQGRLLTAIDDTAITRTITPRAIHSAVACCARRHWSSLDATLRPQTLATVVRLCRHAGVPLCLEPVSVALAPRLEPFIGDAALLTPNMREAAVLTGRPVTNREEALLAARALQERGAGTVIVTMAGAGAVYVSADASGHIPAVQTEALDGAGAGDALTAGVLFGMLQWLPARRGGDAGHRHGEPDDADEPTRCARTCRWSASTRICRRKGGSRSGVGSR